MPQIIEADAEGNIAIRLYMTVNKRSFPELAGLLEGLSRRDQNRVVKGLILRGFLASDLQTSSITRPDKPVTKQVDFGSAASITGASLTKAMDSGATADTGALAPGNDFAPFTVSGIQGWVNQFFTIKKGR